MLIVKTIGRIRREHFVKDKTIKEIVRDLGVSRNTVRKALRSEATAFVYERDVQPPPKLGLWSAKLDDLLKQNAEAGARAAHIDQHFRGFTRARLACYFELIVQHPQGRRTAAQDAARRRAASLTRRPRCHATHW
jgi:hypothetical protein